MPKIPVYSILAFILLSAILGAVMFVASQNSSKVTTMQPVMSFNLMTQTSPVYVSATKVDREVGLARFASFPSDAAMLFVFDQSDLWSMWMKDMKFSIDIAFLDSNKVIRTIYTDVSPDSYPKTFTASVPALYALEFSSGFVQRNALKVGQTVIFDEKTVHNSLKINDK